MTDRRRGAALIEALAAITLIAWVGLALVSLAHESRSVVMRLAQREREGIVASILLRETIVALRSGASTTRFAVGRAGLRVESQPERDGLVRLSVRDEKTRRVVVTTVVRNAHESAR